MEKHGADTYVLPCGEFAPDPDLHVTAAPRPGEKGLFYVAFTHRTFRVPLRFAPTWEVEMSNYCHVERVMLPHDTPIEQVMRTGYEQMEAAGGYLHLAAKVKP